MSIRNLAVRVRDAMRDLKNALRLPTRFLAAKRRGDIVKRIAGFDLVLGKAQDASVLDIGCYDGLIAYEFFRAGAKQIHGLDNDAYHLATANRIFSQVAIDHAFAYADMRQPNAIAKYLGVHYQDQYDIVCFLGVYQHIYRDMSEALREALIHQVSSLASKLLMVRIPAHTWPEFEKYFPAEDFSEVHRIEHADTVGELRVYERNNA